ncbi:MAG: hypothetical protein WAQ33_03245 [Gaiellaceae bacterium]
MRKTPTNDHAPTPLPRDLVREARRLERLRRLRVVTEESRKGPAVQETVDFDPDPQEAA